MKISSKLILNSVTSNEIENLSTPLECQAVLCWPGAILADGTETTSEIIDKLVASVDFAKYNPPVLVQHDWEAEAVIGKLTALTVDGDGRLIASITFTESDAIKKIVAGTWENVSFSATTPEWKLIEVSVVAIPAVEGAKVIQEGTTENAADADAKEDDAEAEEAKADLQEEVAEAEETKQQAIQNAIPDDVELCAKRMEQARTKENTESIDNALTVENARLKADLEAALVENAKLKDEFSQYKRQHYCESLVKAWIENGLSEPATATQEMQLLCTFNDEQIDVYKTLKNAKNPVFGGSRLSVTPTPELDKIQSFVDGYNAYKKAKL